MVGRLTLVRRDRNAVGDRGFRWSAVCSVNAANSRFCPAGDFVSFENDYDRMLRYYNLNLSQINFSYFMKLQVARNNKIRLPSNLGLCCKTIANLEGVLVNLNVNLLDEFKPLITDVFRRQLFGANTAIVVKNGSI